MGLYDDTRDLHHACEAHPVGQRMSTGAITSQEWADWLWAFRKIHEVIDKHHPVSFARVPSLTFDLHELPDARPSEAATSFSEGLTLPEQIEGASYVLHGAHRRGGRVLEKTMESAGLPTSHVRYADGAAVEALIKGYRNRADLAEAARDTFACLLKVMDEIEERKESATIYNGMGAWWFPKSLRLWITVKSKTFFSEASWMRHDEGYALGRPDREVCDKKFLQAMLRDASVRDRPVVTAILALTFWACVRVAGFGSYGTNKK